MLKYLIFFTAIVLSPGCNSFNPETEYKIRDTLLFYSDEKQRIHCLEMNIERKNDTLEIRRLKHFRMSKDGKIDSLKSSLCASQQIDLKNKILYRKNCSKEFYKYFIIDSCVNLQCPDNSRCANCDIECCYLTDDIFKNKKISKFSIRHLDMDGTTETYWFDNYFIAQLITIDGPIGPYYQFTLMDTIDLAIRNRFENATHLNKGGK